MQENLKLSKTLTTCIFNLISAILSIALAISFFILLKVGVIGSGNEGMEGLGFAFVLIVFLPLAIVLYVPILIDAVYKTVFSIILLKKLPKLKATGEIEIGRSLFVWSVVLKIVSTVALAFEALFTYSLIDAGGTPVLAVIFAIIIILIAVFHIAIIFMEKSSRKELFL